MSDPPERNLEEALREKSEELDRFFSLTPDLFCIADTLGRFLKLNRAWEGVLGYRLQDLEGEKFLNFVHPEDVAETVKAMDRLSAGQDIMDFINRYRCRDGSYRWLEWRSAPFEGRLIYAVARDVTARIQGEEALAASGDRLQAVIASAPALQQSEDKFKLAFDTSPDAVNINRLKDGLYVDINQGFTSLTGFTREDVIGRTSHEINIWHDPADRRRLVQSLQERGYCENLEAQFRRKDGSLTTALMSARVLMLGGVPHIISITRDISERIRAAEETKKLEAQLRQAQKMEAIGTLAGGIAHDFNNILGAILGFTQLTLFDLPEGSELRSNLEQVLRACDRARDLVKQILAFSRRSEMEKAPLRLLPVVKEALKLLRASLPTSLEIHKKLEIKEDLVLGDPTQMHQVLMNLCTNAAQAIRTGRGIIEVGLEELVIPAGHPPVLSGLKPGLYIRLTVRDTGEGIDPKIMDHIFDPFFTTKKAGEGTGMGLAVVHGIVKSHGGEITVTSRLGEGSIFQVYLPRVRIDEETGRKSESSSPTGNERILFVDDEPSLVVTWTRLLERWGYRVTSRGSSLEALEIFRAEPDRFDLVITDQTMPGLTGVELAREMLTIRPDLPIILCSGYSFAINPEIIRSVGIRKFLLKPVLPLDMGTNLRRVLEGLDG